MLINGEKSRTKLSRPKYVFAASLIFVTAAAAWLLSFQFAMPVSAPPVETVEADVPGPLDGMTFAGAIGTPSEQNRIRDRFVFSNGKFFSTECVKTCGYHAGSYFVRKRDGRTEFLSVSRCTFKDAKIEWRGTIQDGVVKGESIWTVKRWYRTIEKRLVFEGRLDERPVPVAGKLLDER